MGKKYNVSDKSVQKWCKYYNLPYKAKEIRQYIVNLYGEQPQWFKSSKTISKNYLIEEAKKHRKAILQYDLDNNLIQEFESLTNAAKQGYHETMIRECCKGIRKTYKGYIWNFKQGD